MTLGERCFAAWAPDVSIWSAWAKPVAFVQAEDVEPGLPPTDAELPSIPIAVGPTGAVVVDLPGAEAVFVGLALAERGLRPVPLFNGTTGPSAVIDILPIIRALVAGAERLQRLPPAPDAAPAFLLDSRRHNPATGVRAGMYDNRWVTLPQDFPSGALLASRGIHHVTLIQRDSSASTSPSDAPAKGRGLASGDKRLARESRGYIVSKAGLSIHTDLAHVLRRWQDHGIVVRVIDLTGGKTVDNVSVPTPSGFQLVSYSATALLGLRRSNVGGFGSMIPEQIARSGFYG